MHSILAQLWFLRYKFRNLDLLIVRDLTWNQSAVVAVKVGVTLWCVQEGGVAVA